MSTRLGVIAAVFLLQVLASAQSVVAVHSGVVNYFEGAVSVDGTPLEQKFGHFQEVKQGSELRSDQGRAEILLTPGVLLRVDENSSIRMLSTRLDDTRVDFIGGSVVVDSTQATAPVVVSFKEYQVRFKQPGKYRLNSAPAALRVEVGEAQVALSGKTVVVGDSRVLPFTPALIAQFASTLPPDEFDRWSLERSQMLSAENQSAAASDKLSDEMDNPQADSAANYGSNPFVLSPGDVWLSSPGIGSWDTFSPYAVRAGLYEGLFPLYYPSGVWAYGYLPANRSHLAGPYRQLPYTPYIPPGAWRHGGLVHTTPPTAVRRPSSPGLFTRPVTHGIGAVHAVGHR